MPPVRVLLNRNAGAERAIILSTVRSRVAGTQAGATSTFNGASRQVGGATPADKAP